MPPPRLLLVAVAVAVATVAAAAEEEAGGSVDALRVRTRAGWVRGTAMRTAHGRFFRAFRGVPYAEAPVGERRFRPPADKRPWEGTLDALREGAPCLQVSHLNLSESGSEDCLFLNVYAHVGAENHPVLVYMHGGSFLEGHGGLRFVEPQLLMEHDLLLVSFNYRLGPFGFLSTEDAAMPGNYGLKARRAGGAAVGARQRGGVRGRRGARDAGGRERRRGRRPPAGAGAAGGAPAARGAAVERRRAVALGAGAAGHPLRAPRGAARRLRPRRALRRPGALPARRRRARAAADVPRAAPGRRAAALRARRRARQLVEWRGRGGGAAGGGAGGAAGAARRGRAHPGRGDVGREPRVGPQPARRRAPGGLRGRLPRRGDRQDQPGARAPRPGGAPPALLPGRGVGRARAALLRGERVRALLRRALQLPGVPRAGAAGGVGPRARLLLRVRLPGPRQRDGAPRRARGRRGARRRPALRAGQAVPGARGLAQRHRAACGRAAGGRVGDVRARGAARAAAARGALGARGRARRRLPVPADRRAGAGEEGPALPEEDGVLGEAPAARTIRCDHQGESFSIGAGGACRCYPIGHQESGLLIETHQRWRCTIHIFC